LKGPFTGAFLFDNKKEEMILEQEVFGKVKKDYFFITGKLKLNNPKSLINKIKEGVKKSNNNFTTNVYGYMTPWKYFVNDQEFLTELFPLLDKLDSLPFIKNYDLQDAWGLIEGWGGRTRRHSHSTCYISGALYLNEHPQELIFPEINQKVKPEVGKFALFSSDLTHFANRNRCQDQKYGIAFNFNTTQYD